MQQRILSVAAALLALTLGGAASAQSCSCSSQQVTDGAGAGNANLTTALTGNTVCVAKAGGGWENQEAHVSGGALVDYKRGPGHPVDPRAQVGTWAISGTGANTAVSHTYGSTTYTWKVCTTKSNGKPVAGDSIGFCSNGSASSSISATLKAGTNTPC
jgi:hypothetical protein